MRLRLPAIAFIAVSAAGCQHGPPPVSEAARQIHALQAKLHVGMTEQQVNQALGQPTQFRPGHGGREDVAVYKLQSGALTIYYAGGKLDRTRSSSQPVNR